MQNCWKPVLQGLNPNGFLTYQVDNSVSWDPACFSASEKARRTENPAASWPSQTDV